MGGDLQKSDTLWLDPEVSSQVRIGEFRLTQDVTVQRVEYVDGLPSLIPLPEIPTAFVIDLNDPKFAIQNKQGHLYSADALVKNKVCVSVSWYSLW